MAVRCTMLLLSMLAVGTFSEETNSATVEQNEKMTLNIQCCLADSILPIVFRKGGDSCQKYLPQDGKREEGGVVKSEEGVTKSEESVAKSEENVAKIEGGVAKSEVGVAKGDADVGCLAQCMLEANGLLHGNKTINVEELIKTLMAAVEPDARNVLQTALDKCFKAYNEKDKQENERCKDTQLVFTCLTLEVLQNCPASFWRQDDKCRQFTPQKNDETAA